MKICGKTECPLYANGTPMLSPMVMGQNPKVMIVVDCPDAKETKRIFSSEQYRFLQDKIGDSEILTGENSLVLATAVRCHCDQNEYTESHRKKAIKCCREYFLKTIEKYKPKLILSFGGMALNQTTKQSGVKKYQGTLYKSEELDCYVMPMYAPGYILRNQSHEETWNTAFNQVKNFIKRGWSEDCTALKSVSTRDFREVQSIKGLFTRAEALDGIAIDTETQGLDWTHPLFTCISYSIAVTQNKSYQIFLFEECLENEKDYSILWERKVGAKKVKQLVHVKRSENFENKVRELRWFLENDDIKKIMHNGNYDCHVFQAFFKVAGRLLKLPQDKRTVQIKGYNFDTQNAAQLYNENVYAMARLEQLQFAFTDIPDRYDTGEFKQAYDKSDMLAVPKDALSLYAEFDTAVTKAASVTLKKYLSENKKLERYMTNMVMPTLETLREMETCGVYVDTEALTNASLKIKAMSAEAHEKALSLAPVKIKEAHEQAGLKLSRTALVRDILYSEDGFKLPVKNTTKSKMPATDQDTIKLLQESVRSKKIMEFFKNFVDYKKYDKLVSTYLEGFKGAVASDGNIHTKFSSCFATTGRVASSRPNLMNIPNKGDAAAVVRRIIAARKGWKVLKADASQAELRWMAHYARERQMLKIFREGKVDIHSATAQFVSGHTDKTWAALSAAEKKILRKQAKCVNFGLIYGMSVQGYVNYAKIVYDLADMTEETGQQHSDSFFSKYSGLRPYYEEVTAFGRKYGYVESALGRRRYLPELKSNNRGLLNQAIRQAVNFPTQSASSDSVLLGGNEILKMKLPKRDFRLCLFIHDELVAFVREDCDIEKYGRIMKESIENPPLKKLFGVNLTVPLESEVEWGDNLNDCKELKL